MTSAARTRYRRGLWAERVALLLLSLKGYAIMGRRTRTPLGEVDIVARRGQTLVLVEVKYRQDMAAALSSISPQQQQRLQRAARYLAARWPNLTTVRWDVIALAPWRWPRHIVNAWQ